MRLDLFVVERGWARSRSAAQHLIRSGRVSVDGVSETKCSRTVGSSHRVRVESDPWVSRSAHKLLGAVAGFELDLAGAVVLDAGASTGGFTQVCLEHGAIRVHAVDVGHDQLAPLVRADPRVVVWEGFNLRDLVADSLGEPVDVVVADLSFISLSLVLRPLLAVLREGGRAMVLVKPQFEVGRAGLDARGVVKNADDAWAAVQRIMAAAESLGCRVEGPLPAAVTGESGNQEFFLLLTPTR